MSQGILYKKFKRFISIPWFFNRIVFFLAGWIIFLIPSLFLAMLANIFIHNDKISIAGAIILAVIIDIFFMCKYYKEEEKNRIECEHREEEDKAETIRTGIEHRVNKVIKITVVSRIINTDKEGKISRELLLRDPIGRVITYGKLYSQQENLNTVFYAIEDGKTYDMEWNLQIYDPTGKRNEYRKILKIDEIDVDLTE
jgi:hypothetical protein